LLLVAQNDNDAATDGFSSETGRSDDQRCSSVSEQLFGPAEPGRTAGCEHNRIEFLLCGK